MPSQQWNPNAQNKYKNLIEQLEELPESREGTMSMDRYVAELSRSGPTGSARDGENFGQEERELADPEEKVDRVCKVSKTFEIEAIARGLRSDWMRPPAISAAE